MAEQPQSGDSLANLFWPDLAQDGARAAQRSTLTALNPLSWLEADRARPFELSTSGLWGRLVGARFAMRIEHKAQAKVHFG